MSTFQRDTEISGWLARNTAKLAAVSKAAGKKLAANREARTLRSSYPLVCKTLSVGFATWQQVGDCLAGQTAPGGRQRFVDGFLSDLKRRKLWNARN